MTAYTTCTFLLDGQNLFATLQSDGSKTSTYHTRACECVMCEIARTIRYLNPVGARSSAVQSVFFSSLKIGEESSKHGALMDTLASKWQMENSKVDIERATACPECKAPASYGHWLSCSQFVSDRDWPHKPQVATPPDKPHTTPMAANERQVGGTHYRSPIQHWDYVLANEIPYLEAQVIKYLTRWRKKNGKQDVEKAVHYLQKLCEAEGISWPKTPETAAVPERNDGAEPGPGYVGQTRERNIPPRRKIPPE